MEGRCKELKKECKIRDNETEQKREKYSPSAICWKLPTQESVCIRRMQWKV